MSRGIWFVLLLVVVFQGLMQSKSKGKSLSLKDDLVDQPKLML